MLLLVIQREPEKPEIGKKKLVNAIPTREF